jgi:hypothetical protein
MPEPLVLIIRKHVGAGILPEEARALGLPDRDYFPSTLEENRLPRRQPGGRRGLHVGRSSPTMIL